MATVLPPPSKRQKTAIAEKAKEQQSLESVPDNLWSVRVQFSNQSSGHTVGAPVSVPVTDATVHNLELLLNTLQGNVCVQVSSSSRRTVCSAFNILIKPSVVLFF